MLSLSLGLILYRLFAVLIVVGALSFVAKKFLNIPITFKTFGIACAVLFVISMMRIL